MDLTCPPNVNIIPTETDNTANNTCMKRWTSVLSREKAPSTEYSVLTANKVHMKSATTLDDQATVGNARDIGSQKTSMSPGIAKSHTSDDQRESMRGTSTEGGGNRSESRL